MGSSGEAKAYRVINFCDLQTQTEFRLVTNLSHQGDAAVSDDEIRDIYRLRWGVELLWKFLKMPEKLDKLITKNVKGITIQRENYNVKFCIDIQHFWANYYSGVAAKETFSLEDSILSEAIASQNLIKTHPDYVLRW